MITILYVLLGLIALVLIVGLFISKDMNYEKSITISAPIGQVWGNVNSLSALDKWSPWNEKDPNMEKEFSGTDGTPGAKQSWKSNVKDVGEGSQTIVKVTEPTSLETRLDFIKPFKSTADAYVKLNEENAQTTATWGFKSQMPYPMNLMKVFMNFEKSMDEQFGTGLSKLKSICEQ
ncbi:MAG: SRPBCC family protein [Cyclobacteriaceae bacterium]